MTCPVLMELGPANISPLPSGTVLRFVSREHWQSLQEKEDSLPGSDVLTWKIPVACGNQKYKAHLHGQLPPKPQRLTFQCITPGGSFPAISTVWRPSMDGFPQHQEECFPMNTICIDLQQTSSSSSGSWLRNLQQGMVLSPLVEGEHWDSYRLVPSLGALSQPKRLLPTSAITIFFRALFSP